MALTFDADANLLLSQAATGTIQSIRKYSPTGTSLGDIGTIGSSGVFADLAFDAAGNLYATVADEVWRFSSTGVPVRFARTGDGPAGMAFERHGNLLVALVNAGGGRIDKFSPEGVLLQSFGQGRLSTPVGLALDRNGILYVSSIGSDSANKKLSGCAQLKFAFE